MGRLRRGYFMEPSCGDRRERATVLVSIVVAVVKLQDHAVLYCEQRNKQWRPVVC